MALNVIRSLATNSLPAIQHPVVVCYLFWHQKTSLSWLWWSKWRPKPYLCRGDLGLQWFDILSIDLPLSLIIICFGAIRPAYPPATSVQWLKWQQSHNCARVNTAQSFDVCIHIFFHLIDAFKFQEIIFIPSNIFKMEWSRRPVAILDDHSP